MSMPQCMSSLLMRRSGTPFCRSVCRNTRSSCPYRTMHSSNRMVWNSCREMRKWKVVKCARVALDSLCSPYLSRRECCVSASGG